MHRLRYLVSGMITLLLTAIIFKVQAQTDNDAIMMNKHQWCNGATYDHAQWNSYWEGTFKRTNANIGTLTTQSVMFMSNYGITDKLNVLAGVPYIWTDASAGTLHGLHGFQDLSVYLKWKPLTFGLGKGTLSLFAILGFSTPTNNYDISLLPLSIGLGSTNVIYRGMAYYRRGIFFIRASGTYIWRSNVTLDQSSYYTTQEYNTNQVEMPNQTAFNGSVGIYKKYLIAEVMVDNLTTLGGFDMRKNDMPFVSNKMNYTSLGAHIKYTFPFDPHISVVGGGNYVLAGRNVGQTLDFSFGAYYALYVKGHAKTSRPPLTNQ
jgi:hypothetical protein